MAKIPVNLIIDSAKKHGPKTIKYLKENQDNILKFAPLAVAGAAKFKKIYDDKKISLAEKEHYRKARYSEYKNSILGKLSELNKQQLVNYIDEVESFIEQIENEEKEEVVLKKPLHFKRRDDWKKILIQLEDKMNVVDYQEYLKLFNNPNYIGSYFEDYDRKLNTYKKLIEEDNIERIREFISKNTEKPRQVIERDFV